MTDEYGRDAGWDGVSRPRPRANMRTAVGRLRLLAEIAHRRRIEAIDDAIAARWADAAAGFRRGRS